MKQLLVALVFLTLGACHEKHTQDFEHFEGLALGTTFHISFEKPSDEVIKEKHIDSLIHLINKSLSTYMPNSDISKINKGDSTIVVDEYFVEVFKKSNKIYQETKGAFDPTIGILVNAWGFGPSGELEKVDSAFVDSVLQWVGFSKVALNNHRVRKYNPDTFLDFNAIAKGYTVDIIGRFLESHDVTNYMVEIGGEIRVRGKNSKDKLWKIGIEQPHFDSNRSIQNIVTLHNESIATSGNYRKFKIDDKGQKYAHTINTKTGYPSKSNLLSASVIGKLDCADVDAYATAFMAMGLEKTKTFLQKKQDLKAFLIYSKSDGSIETYQTDNLKLED